MAILTISISYDNTHSIYIKLLKIKMLKYKHSKMCKQTCSSVKESSNQISVRNKLFFFKAEFLCWFNALVLVAHSKLISQSYIEV